MKVHDVQKIGPVSLYYKLFFHQLVRNDASVFKQHFTCRKKKQKKKNNNNNLLCEIIVPFKASDF